MSDMSNDMIEFQADALEIKNQRLPLFARYSVWLSLIFLLLALGWAWFSKVDIIIQAPGKLVSREPNLVMKPLERTVIKEVNVQIGDIVEEGQILITFDPTSELAEKERLEHECMALQAQYDRLQAEYSGYDYTVVGAPNPMEVLQLSLFEQRKKFYQERMLYFKEAIQQLEVSQKSCEEMIRKQEERLATVIDIEAAFKDMFEKDAATTLELLQNQVSRIEVESAVMQLKNQYLERIPQINSARASMNSFCEEWASNIGEDLFKTERELQSTLMALEKVNNLANFVYLKAPCKAMVHEIAAFSIGSAVREAEALITLIPLNGDIEVEAEIRTQDIGKIKMGSEARVKLTAYPFQKHGTLDGMVRNISEDTFQRQGAREGSLETSAMYYRARISVSGELTNVNDNFRLIPGMEVQAEIKAGKRRILEYLIYPLIKAFDETAREP